MTFLKVDIDGIVMSVGNYGSGKTEVAINLAAERRLAGTDTGRRDVRIADLDLVNPYFRTREAKAVLEELGVEIVLPPAQYLHADLPVLSPSVAGMIRHSTGLTILDAGGDDVGAYVISALADALKDRPARMLQVVNPFRPFTDTVEGCLKIRTEIEKAARKPVSGIIGNANMIDSTTPETIYKGYEFAETLSEAWDLPLEFVTVATDLMGEVDTDRFFCPVLPVRRQLVPPWKHAVKIEGANK